LGRSAALWRASEGWRLAAPAVPRSHSTARDPRRHSTLEVDAKARHASAGQLAFDLQHPDAIVLTERAERRKRSSLLTVATRYYLAARGRPQFVQTCSRQLARAPIVMAAVDLSNGTEPLAEALRLTVRQNRR